MTLNDRNCALSPLEVCGPATQFPRSICVSRVIIVFTVIFVLSRVDRFPSSHSVARARTHADGSGEPRGGLHSRSVELLADVPRDSFLDPFRLYETNRAVTSIIFYTLSIDLSRPRRQKVKSPRSVSLFLFLAYSDRTRHEAQGIFYAT